MYVRYLTRNMMSKFKPTQDLKVSWCGGGGGGKVSQRGIQRWIYFQTKSHGSSVALTNSSLNKLCIAALIRKKLRNYLFQAHLARLVIQ